MTAPGDFGAELRRRRLAAGISLAELAKRLHYSKGYLSKIETQQQQATEKLARLADSALGAEGALVRPFLTARQAAGERAEGNLNRRDILALSGPLLVTATLSQSDARAAADDIQIQDYYWTLFKQYRLSGQQYAPEIVLRGILAELYTLVELAEAARSPHARSQLAVLAARYAEYAGWMAQESGDPRSALAWTRKAADIASEAGTDGLAAYSLVREAELAMYDHDGLRTVRLAQRAAAHPGADARVRGLAEHRQAQGHALLGDYRDCRLALDRAERLLDQHEAATGSRTIGPTTINDLGLAVSGWCFYDLGRPRQAAESIEKALTRTVPTARRARSLYGARLALAYEAAGELDRMVHVGRQVLSDARAIGSATVRTQLRDLARTIVRQHNYGPARELQAAITVALSTLD